MRIFLETLDLKFPKAFQNNSSLIKVLIRDNQQIVYFEHITKEGVTCKFLLYDSTKIKFFQRKLFEYCQRRKKLKALLLDSLKESNNFQLYKEKDYIAFRIKYQFSFNII